MKTPHIFCSDNEKAMALLIVALLALFAGLVAWGMP